MKLKDYYLMNEKQYHDELNELETKHKAEKEEVSKVYEATKKELRAKANEEVYQMVKKEKKRVYIKMNDNYIPDNWKIIIGAERQLGLFGNEEIFFIVSGIKPSVPYGEWTPSRFIWETDYVCLDVIDYETTTDENIEEKIIALMKKYEVRV